MSDSVNFCILSNPDISGIGGFTGGIAILGNTVDDYPHHGIRTLGLTNFHATIILDLSWMNNTNTFIYFLLFIRNKATPPSNDEEADKSYLRKYIERLSNRSSGQPNGPQRTSQLTPKYWSRWLANIIETALDPVVIIGSLHVSYGCHRNLALESTGHIQ
ncbi:hypothetical protein M422DRAFT_261462 [Sphaerobolus stellatus SS14]|uniref:Uncharacterized protein n=1 Tax=Sphaerobolus stellatus (strain SS14) TaxID=990650 RepID=A0A0C9VFE5_SPHS4|nr:hypothetical protein M422DRAFT_261462 [Sphaerobolus stellatus SS14]